MPGLYDTLGTASDAQLVPAGACTPTTLCVGVLTRIVQDHWCVAQLLYLCATLQGGEVVLAHAGLCVADRHRHSFSLSLALSSLPTYPYVPAGSLHTSLVLAMYIR